MKNSESTAELRAKITALTLTCPKGIYEGDCPFRLFQGLCEGTKKNTLGQMDHAALMKLFDFPSSCVCPADPRLGAPDFLAGGADI